jgi:hypothetical protein
MWDELRVGLRASVWNGRPECSTRIDANAAETNVAAVLMNEGVRRPTNERALGGPGSAVMMRRESCPRA